MLGYLCKRVYLGIAFIFFLTGCISSQITETELSPSELIVDRSILLDEHVRITRVNQTERIIVVGSFANDESPYYITLEDWKRVKNIVTYRAALQSDILYFKIRIDKRGKTPSTMYELLNYTIRTAVCDDNICYGPSRLNKNRYEGFSISENYVAIPEEFRPKIVILYMILGSASSLTSNPGNMVVVGRIELDKLSPIR
ncbi:MAG: hypothetical protein QXD03_01570 [Candidatus Anstonellales archaeon]